jgi:LPXTG-site transpeptidase (sortase) family protein
MSTISMSKKTTLRLAGLCIGLTLLAYGLFITSSYIRYRQAAHSSVPSIQVAIPEKPFTYKPETITGKPVRLVVPSLQIDISIIDGTYNQQSGTWTLTNDKAQFASVTALPNNEKGNTYIYGHALPKVFASLHKMSAKAAAIIYTDNGHEFTYEYRSMAETTPKDTSALAVQDGIPTLSLQTCSGMWYQNRQIYSFDFVSVKS